MPKLASCIECGRAISPLARQCPHQGCKTSTPFGFRCKICGNLGKMSTVKTIEETISWYEPENNEVHSYEEINNYHLECYNKVLEIDYSCPACIQIVKQTQKSCPLCGHPFETSRCHHCKQPILKELSIFYKGKAFHKFCADIKKPSWEREEAEDRRRDEQRRKEAREAEQRRKEAREAEAERKQNEQERRRREEVEEAEVKRKRKQKALIEKGSIAFVVILSLVLAVNKFYLPLSLVVEPLWTSFVKNISGVVMVFIVTFVVGIIPLIGELICGLYFLGLVLGSLFSLVGYPFSDFVLFFIVILGSGSACVIRGFICSFFE